MKTSEYQVGYHFSELQFVFLLYQKQKGKAAAVLPMCRHIPSMVAVTSDPTHPNIFRRLFVPVTHWPTRLFGQPCFLFWKQAISPPLSSAATPSIRPNMRPSTSHQAACSLLCPLPAVLFSWPPVVVLPLPPPPLPLLHPPPNPQTPSTDPRFVLINLIL